MVGLGRIGPVANDLNVKLPNEGGLRPSRSKMTQKVIRCIPLRLSKTFTPPIGSLKDT